MSLYIPRVYPDILQESADTLKYLTEVSDFNRGGPARTVLEVLASEADELHYQLFLIRASYSILTSTGSDLDARAAEWGQKRLFASSSTGFVQFTLESAVATTVLDFGDLDGTNDYLTADSSTGFPSNSFVVKVGEGTENEELLYVTINDFGTGVMTIYPKAENPHDPEESVTLVSGNDIIIQSGIRLSTRATATDPSVEYITTGVGVVTTGNTKSSLVPAIAVQTGSITNVSADTITKFSSNPPTGVGVVTNPSGFFSGMDLETDDEFRQRIVASIQALAKGTMQVLLNSPLGLVDSTTGQRVVSTSLVQDPSTGYSILYVDDGSGTAEISNQLARSDYDTNMTAPSSIVPLINASAFPLSGYVLISPELINKVELLKYENVSGNNLELEGTTSTDHLTTDNDLDVLLVDVLVDESETGQKRFKTKFFPVVSNSVRLYLREGATGTFTRIYEGTDYDVNLTNGDVFILNPENGLPAGSALVATYSYYSGLLAYVQKVVNGDPDNTTEFPGLAAVGPRIAVRAPSRKNLSFVLSIVAERNATEENLYDPASDAVYNYINSLGVGEDVILAEIIQRVKAVAANGVEPIRDVKIISPTENITVLENQLPRVERENILVT